MSLLHSSTNLCVSAHPAASNVSCFGQLCWEKHIEERWELTWGTLNLPRTMWTRNMLEWSCIWCHIVQASILISFAALRLEGSPSWYKSRGPLCRFSTTRRSFSRSLPSTFAWLVHQFHRFGRDWVPWNILHRFSEIVSVNEVLGVKSTEDLTHKINRWFIGGDISLPTFSAIFPVKASSDMPASLQHS